MSDSRTTKSILNAKIALVFYFANLILSFFSRKIFLDYLGPEVLGLNSTASTLLGFLNLAELGIGGAISFSLYAPLFQNNKKAINEIVTIQGYWYRKIAWIVIGGSVLLMFFFPLFFAKSDLPLWYAYTTFIVLLCSSLFSYFWNYRQILLVADQKQYKITSNQQSWKTIKVILQIIAIIYISNGYLVWILLEFIFSIIMTVSLNRLINKEYNWLKPDISQGAALSKAYPELIIKTKQLFYHKIGTFVLDQTAPLIIFAYSNLVLVSIYGNYMLIITGMNMLLGAIFNSIGAGVGNLVAQGDRNRIHQVFWELFSIRFLLSTTACVGVYFFANPFICLWIGEEYLLDNLSLFLIVSIMYIGMMRTVVDSFITAYGLYGDIWATLTEASLNLGLSVLLGYFFGLPGILTGVLISLIIIIFIWKPYYCCRYGMKMPYPVYLKGYIKHILAFAIALVPLLFITHSFPYSEPSIFNFISYALYVISPFFSTLFILLFVSSIGMKDFVKRILVSRGF